MSTSQAEVAEEVSHTLDEDVSKFICEQGQLRLESLQVAAHAIDARCTQVSTLLFAAAALSAAAISPSLSLSTSFAVLATIAFIWGGVAAFRGIRSDEFCLPGIAPAWWVGALQYDSFTLKDARAWKARLLQEGIEQVEGENHTRAENLNASLRLAVIGAVLVGLAAAARVGPAIHDVLSAI